MRKRRKSKMVLELYYDSTVEPFENPKFERAEVMEMLKMARASGITVRFIDTAGWERELLMECYRRIMGRRKTSQIFGPKGRRGWFFGREVPALIVLKGKKREIYPMQFGGYTITISGYLRNLLKGGSLW